MIETKKAALVAWCEWNEQPGDHIEWEPFWIGWKLSRDDSFKILRTTIDGENYVD